MFPFLLVSFFIKISIQFLLLLDFSAFILSLIWHIQLFFSVFLFLFSFSIFVFLFWVWLAYSAFIFRFSFLVFEFDWYSSVVFCVQLFYSVILAYWLAYSAFIFHFSHFNFSFLSLIGVFRLCFVFSFSIPLF